MRLSCDYFPIHGCSYGVDSATRKIHIEYSLYDFSFAWLNNKSLINQAITKWSTVSEERTVFHFHSVRGGHSARACKCFALSKCTLNVKDEFGVHRFGINIIVFKNNADTALFQFSDSLKTFKRVSRKTRNAFNVNSIYSPKCAILNESLEFFTLIHTSSRYAFIGININENHITLRFKKIIIVFHLGEKRICLIFRVCTDSAIRCYSYQLFCFKTNRRLNDLNILIDRHNFSRLLCTIILLIF